MKNILKYLLFVTTLFVLTTGCDKKDTVQTALNGTACTLRSSATTVNADFADSTNTLLTLNWTNPHYAVDSSSQKFVVEIDTSGTFVNKASVTLTGTLTKSFNSRDLNAIMFNLGLSLGQTYPLNFRIKSSYSNNNNLLSSNVVKVNATFAGGSPSVATSSLSSSIIPINAATYENEAVKFSWTNAGYAFGTNNGNNSIKYSLQIDRAGSNFSSPTFQSLSLDTCTMSYVSLSQHVLNLLLINAGYTPAVSASLQFRIVATLGGVATTSLPSAPVSFSATPIYKAAITLPSSGNLYIIGDATFGGSDSGWNNPVPVPSQQFTKIDSLTYIGTFYLHGGGSTSYLFLPVNNGDWSHKYAVADAKVVGLNKGGTFGYDLNDNMPGPDSSGNYQIKVDFLRGKFTVTKQ